MRRKIIRRALRKLINWILKDNNKLNLDTDVQNTRDTYAKNVILGQFVNIGKNVIFYGIEPIKIGNHTMVGSGVIILSIQMVELSW